MSNWTIRQQIDLAQGAVEPRVLPNALLMQGDKLAHEWRITVLQDGQPATLAGTVRGYFQRADGNYVPIDGTIDGHTAVVKLESSCYAVPGPLQCVMRLTNASGGGTVTLGSFITTVEREPGGGVVDVEHIIPDISQLLAQIAVMEAGTQTANAAASAANTAAGAATSAAEQASGAASTAQAAATAATDAASAAQTAASDVATATEAAQAAAQEAGDAASDAILATGEADDAADAANTAAAAANSAASGANAAKAAANTAAGAANTAAGSASAAATAANAAASAANAAAYEIDGMTIEVAVVPYGTTPVATITEVGGHKHISVQVQRGPQGPGYTIKGTAYETLAALQAAIPNPTEGDQYNVGSAAPFHVYRWTGMTYEDQGELQGPKGDKGVTFTPAVSSGGELSFTNDGDEANPAPVNLAQSAAAAVPAVRFDVDQTADYNEAQKAQARANMGAASVAAVEAKADGLTHTATLPTSGWSGTGPYTYTANVADVTADNTVLAGPAPASKSAYEGSGAYPSAQGAGTLTFTAESVPASQITVNVVILNL